MKVRGQGHSDPKILCDTLRPIENMGTVCAILVECIKRNNSVIFFNLDQWFRGCHLKDFLSGALAALVFGGAEPFMQFW